MRLNIRTKIILIGAGLSALLMLVSLFVSYYIYTSRLKTNFVESLDQNMDKAQAYFADSVSEGYLSNLCTYFLEIYDVETDRIDENAPIEEKFEYYKKKYATIYPSDMLIMSQYRLSLQNAYFILSSELISLASIPGVNYAYIAYHDSDADKWVYIVDSEYRLDEKISPNTHLPGDVYTLKSNNEPFTQKGSKYETMYVNDDTMLHFDIYREEINSDDSVEKQYTATLYMEYDESSATASSKSFMVTEIIALAASTLVLVVGYALIAYFVIAKNIAKLTNTTKSFTKRVLDGEQLEVIDPSIKANDELGVLSDSFIALEQEIIRYTDKIASDAAEKASLNAELNVATQIQMEDLPASSYSDDRVTIEASITPAKEVGGDFYDYFHVDDNHLAVIVADVSGKGVPAALFMMKAKELIKAKLKAKKSLADTMFEVNNTLLEGNKTGLFVTAFVGTINLANKTLRFVSAGHERPYLVGDEIVRVETDANFVLGGIKNFKYNVNEVKIDDKRLFVFTDGLNEAINDKNEEFDYAGIVRSLEGSKNLACDCVLDAVKSDLKAFVGDKEAFDDVTLMLIELANPKKLDLTFDNPGFEIIETVTDKFNETFKHIDRETLAKLDVVIDEMLNNYVSYESNEQGYQIKVSAKETNGELELVFNTNGEEFDTLSVGDKHINDAGEGGIGGFGITITRSIVDDVKYERKDDRNVLTIIKKV